MPARFALTVYRSNRYIASGSSIFSPSLYAGVGVTGPAIRSTSLERLVEVLADQPPDLQRLQVIGVVVAGTQGVGAQHDAAFHFGAEALRPGPAVQPDQRRCPGRPSPAGRRPPPAASRFGLQLGQHRLLVGAVAVVDAVVAGQVAGGLAGGDDVVRGHRVLAVRQRQLLAPSRPATRTPAPPRAPPPRLRRPGPSPKCSRTTPSRKSVQRLAHASAVYGGTGTSTEVESSGSWPASTSSSSATSSAVRASGPIWSRLLANATSP